MSNTTEPTERESGVRVQYREFPPPADLIDVLECGWTLQAAQPYDVARGAIFPDGCPELVVHLGDPFGRLHHGVECRQPAVLFAGQLRAPLHLLPTGRVDVVALRFRAEGAHRFLGRVADVGDGWADPGDLGARSLDGLRARLDDLQQPAARVTALFDALRRALRHPADRQVSAACRIARQLMGRSNVATLASTVGLGTRTLQRRFRRHVGLAPKQYLRILRFRDVVHSQRFSRQPLVQAALAAGYFDQAHLVRDFQQFAGCSPGRFFARSADATTVPFAVPGP